MPARTPSLRTLHPALIGLALLFLPLAAGAQLVVAGNQFWSQDSAGISSSAEEGDGFGSALAAGDFDGDGFGDLAIGVPSEAHGTVQSAGGVHILYGGRAGLAASGTQFWSQDSSFVPDDAEAFDSFGEVLAAGDLDCDGFDDLAVAAPHEDFLLAHWAGTVHVFWGSADGLTPIAGMAGTIPLTTRLDADDFSPAAGRQGFADFGAALAIGVVRSGGVPVGTFLAIGTPGHDAGSVAAAGAVFTYVTDCGSRSLQTSRYIHQDAEEGGVGVAGAAEASDHFGAALAAGDFDGDGRDDLAVGVPGEDIDSNTLLEAGALALFDTASTTGPRFAGNVLVDQSTSGMAGIARAGDQFASVLVAGDFDADGHDDLAIGTPTDRNSSGDAVGGVVIVYGSAAGLDLARSDAWNASSFSLPLADDGFGQALAVGSFDGDIEDDLAIGAPFADVGGALSAGRVHILYGGSSGLALARSQIFDQGTGGLANSPGFADALGKALAAGDFDGNGEGDLGIGVPAEDIGTVNTAGAVAVVYGSNVGKLGDARFALSSSSAAEAGNSTVTVQRLGSALLAASVDVQRTGGSATPGTDFSFATTTVSWDAGDFADKTVALAIVPDTLDEGNETVVLGFASPSAELGLASPTQHTFTILDNDQGGVVLFAAASFAAFENAGSVSIEVQRLLGAASGVTVQYAATAGTASAPADFTAVSGTLTFAAGESAKTFSIPLVNDALAEEYETVLLTLSVPSGGATLGTPASAVLYLRDNDSSSILSDGFESGGLGRWSARRNELDARSFSRANAAALERGPQRDEAEGASSLSSVSARASTVSGLRIRARIPSRSAAVSSSGRR